MRDEYIEFCIIKYKANEMGTVTLVEYADKVSATKEMKNILYGNE